MHSFIIHPYILDFEYQIHLKINIGKYLKQKGQHGHTLHFPNMFIQKLLYFGSQVFANFARISLSNIGGSNRTGSRHRSVAATITYFFLKWWKMGEGRETWVCHTKLSKVKIKFSHKWSITLI